MKRLFVALDLPAGIRARAAAVCGGLPGARWTPEEQLHLTLFFCGEVEMDVFGEIRRALASVRAGPVGLRLEGLGVFPPRGRPLTLWAGVAAGEALLVLQRRVEQALRPVGLEPERRKYLPHVTLARLREAPAHCVGRWLEGHGLFRTEDAVLDRFHLYSSILASDGAEHRLEESWPLTG